MRDPGAPRGESGGSLAGLRILDLGHFVAGLLGLARAELAAHCQEGVC